MGSNGSDNGMIMPVAPMYNGGYGGNGFGFGGDGWWVILFLFALMGNGFGGWGGFNGGMAECVLPYFYNTQTQNDVNRGFDNAGISNQLTGIQSAITSGFGDTALGIAGINQNICQTGGNITSAVSNGFAQAEIAANSRQMANMNQIFGLSQQFSDCCCENRLANCQTNNTIMSESAATRFADANNTRDIIENQTRGNQAILDKLCQLELDAKNDKISDLQSQLTMAQLAANNNLQTQTLLTDNLAQTNNLERYLAPTPIPAYVVQNPNCCANTCGCSGF